MSDWKSLLGGAAIVAALCVALTPILLAVYWTLSRRGRDGDDRNHI